MNYTNYMESRLQRPVTFSLKQTYASGFSYLGKNVGLYVGYTFVYILIWLMANLIASVVPFNIGGYVVKIVLSNALVMGYALFCHKYIVSNTADFSEFFAGFRTNYTQLVVANVAIMLILGVASALLILPFSQELAATYQSLITAQGADPEEVFTEVFAMLTANKWQILAYFIISTLVQLLYLLTNYFIVFFDFGFWEALEASRRLMSRVLPKAFIYLISISFILVLGSLVTLGFGFVLLYPAVMLMSYSLFEQLAVFDEGETRLEDELII